MRILPPLLLLVLLSACGTVQEHRARQMRRDFEQLPPAQRDAVIDGRVEQGFTRVMVYMALGNPRRESRTGNRTTWTYYGWIDDSGRFRSTGDLYAGRRDAMMQMTVEFRGELVASVKVEPLEWPPRE